MRTGYVKVACTVCTDEIVNLAHNEVCMACEDTGMVISHVKDIGKYIREDEIREVEVEDPIRRWVLVEQA